MERLLKTAVIGAALLLVAAVIAGGALFVISGGQPVDYVQKALIRLSLSGRQAELNRPYSADTAPQRFTVSMGDTPRLIAQNLVSASLITDADLFVDYVRLNDLDTQLEAGVFFLNRAQTPAQIAVALTDSASSQFPFRILEGWRIEEVAEAVEQARAYFGFGAAEFLGVVGAGAPIDSTFAAQMGIPPGASLEGFLYPDTYQIPAQVTPEMLRDILLQTFTTTVGGQVLTDAAAQGFTPYQIVTLAAIVQREAVHPDEHPMIASVYRNRLAMPMRLEADPTVQYPLGAPGNWWPRITAANYQDVVSPYNTYLNDGLPPGPIANPSVSAIRAAVYPAQSDFYYFRADCRSDGYHDFARTFDEHLANGC